MGKLCVCDEMKKKLVDGSGCVCDCEPARDAGCTASLVRAPANRLRQQLLFISDLFLWVASVVVEMLFLSDRFTL